MAQLFFNNGRARLAAAISASQTTLQLQGRVNLPDTLAAGDWFLLTLARQDSRYGSNVEVVKVTAVSGDSVTVQRGYEGAAVPHDISEVVECRTTADTYARMLREALWDYIGNKPATATRWPTWAEVTGKPSTFVPSAHTHPWAEITGAPAQATRWPTWTEVEGKPTNFPPATHSHDWSQVANAPATATRWPSWSEVTDKPSTTDSRTSTSATILLQAKGMNDHRNSGDHDDRYHTKTEADGRFLGRASGGDVAGDIAIKKGVTSAATTALHGRQTTEAVVSRVTMANDAETSTPGVLEAWRRAAGSLDLELSGFRQMLLKLGIITTVGMTVQNPAYNPVDLYSDRTAGNLGGIRFHSAGVKKGELNFLADGAIQAASGAFFSGNGQGLTNLPASAIASGVIPTTRLPTTDSRTSSSQTDILTAKAMNDHRVSGDHDSRYVLQTGYNAFDPAGTYTSLRAQGTTKADVGLPNVKDVALNWVWGSGTPTHFWGSEGNATQSYVYSAGAVKTALNLSKSDVGLSSVDNYSRAHYDSRYVSRTGDSMSGDLTISKNNPWMTLNSSTSGAIGVEQAAGLTIGESGYKGAAALHLTYTGDGKAYIGMGSVDALTSIPANYAMQLSYTSKDVTFNGNLQLPDSVTLAGVANGLQIANAANGTVEIGNRNTGYTHYQSSTGKHYFYGTVHTQSGFYGDGGDITGLNASNLATGTVPIARISSTSSRTSSSETILLHAKAMNDHRTSGDHDARYMNKSGDTFSGKLIAESGDRASGIYGTYISSKIDHIWSMGSGYAIPADGSTFGNLYGIAYKHTNNTTGGTMAGGHQVVFCSNGTPGVAIGMAGNVWTSGTFMGNGSGLTDLDASKLTSGTIPNARISGSYTGMTNLTGSGNVDFAKFLGNAGDTVSAPSFTWTGDTNTGLYRPASDTIGIAVAGVERARFSSAGISGVGTGITSLNASNISSGTLNEDRLPSSVVLTSRTITAGNGLSGGGSMAGNRTISMGTPGSITNTSTNSTTSTSHTHELSDHTIRILNARSEAGELGTYMFAWYNQAVNLSVNTVVSGSDLRPATGEGTRDDGYALSGTWRLCGITHGGSEQRRRCAIWLRIS